MMVGSSRVEVSELSGSWYKEAARWRSEDAFIGSSGDVTLREWKSLR